MAKILITSSGNEISAQFDKRFGRAAYFCIYDTINKESIFIENIYAEAGHGAGTKAAENAVESKVDKVISGDFGPKAKDFLDKFNIQMVVVQESSTTISDIIKKIEA